MRNFKCIALLAFSILLLGCSAKIEREYDKFKGESVCSLRRNFIKTKGLYNEMAFDVVQNPRGNQVQVVWQRFNSSMMPLINQKESLTLLVNNEERIPLKMEGPSTVACYESTCTETINYESISTDLLKKIASAKSVEMQLSSNNIKVEGAFTDKNFNNIKKFLTSQ